MAGIGFALRRLSDQDNLIGRALSVGHAAIIAAGPWLFTIASLGLITLTTEKISGLATLETFRAGIIYAFAISLVTASPVVIVTTRLVADGLYERSFERIAGIFIAALLAAAVPALVAVLFFYRVVLDIPLPLAVAAGACCLLVSLIWVALALAGTVRDYPGVTLSFLAGFVVSVAASIAASVYDLGAPGLIWGFNCGLGVTLFGLISRVVSTFPHAVPRPLSGIVELYHAMRRYRVIAFGALAANSAIWADKWMMWLSPIGETVEGGFVHAPLYDSAMFIACLVIIPSLSLFVVHLETDFFQSYQRYFSTIRRHGALRTMEEDRKALTEVTLSALFHIILIQVGLCAAVTLTAPVIADALNLQFRQISILRFGTMGTLFQFIFLACSAVLLFLDRRWAFLVLQIVFLALTVVLTWISIQMGWRYHGLGFFAAALISSICAFVIMERSLANLNFLTFIGNNPSVRGA